MKKAFSIGMMLLFIAAPSFARPCPTCRTQPEEAISQTIYLSHGVTIKEWRGKSVPSEAQIKRLNVLIKKAFLYFPQFLLGFEKYNFQIHRKNVKGWTLSLLPNTRTSRGLRSSSRFKGFILNDEATGYTIVDEKMMVMISDIDSLEFSETVIHEVFHMLFAEWVKNNDVSRVREEWFAHRFSEECMALVPPDLR